LNVPKTTKIRAIKKDNQSGDVTTTKPTKSVNQKFMTAYRRKAGRQEIIKTTKTPAPSLYLRLALYFSMTWHFAVK
jgi:hypothetical protein